MKTCRHSSPKLIGEAMYAWCKRCGALGRWRCVSHGWSWTKPALAKALAPLLHQTAAEKTDLQGLDPHEQ